MATLEFEAAGNGFRARLSRSLFGRIVESAMLLAWLVFWVIAEAFAVIAVAGAISQLFGFAWLARFGEPARADPAVVILFLGFLLFWLTIWTFGGLGALGALLRALSTSEELEVQDGALSVRSGVGPLRRTRRFARDQITWVGLYPRGGPLMLELGERRVLLTQAGSPMDRRRLRDEIRHVLDLPSGERWRQLAAKKRPSGWDVEQHGSRWVVRPSRHLRVQQSLVLLGLAALFLAGAVAPSSSGAPGVVQAARVCAVLAFACAAGAIWLRFGEQRWEFEGKDAKLVRAFPGVRTEQSFAPCALALEAHEDSDGDLHHALFVRGGSTQKRVAKGMNDPRALLQLGLFLSAQTGIGLQAPSDAEEG